MIELKSKKECCGCSACVNICPQKCIIMKEDEEGFIYPAVNAKTCIECNLCRQVCPILNSHASRQMNPHTSVISAARENHEQNASGFCPSTYAAYCLDQEIRQMSSSGGIFFTVAEQVLKTGGIVFGVRLAEDCRSAYHISVENKNELSLLLGSKYMQSNPGNCFSEARRYLEEGRRVLFVGAPCQIEGLKKFLKKDYPYLLCMDFICHGVPSPKTWRKYLKYRERQANDSACAVQFRNKNFGWQKYQLSIQFENGGCYRKEHAEDLYMKLFLNNISMRPSCYSCSFRKINRVSDLTIADFWGIGRTVPEMDDDKGTSLIVVHSAKGKDLLEAIRDQIRLKEVDAKRAFSENPSVKKQPVKPLLRGRYFTTIDRLPIETAGARYLILSEWKKKLRKIKKSIILSKKKKGT